MLRQPVARAAELGPFQRQFFASLSSAKGQRLQGGAQAIEVGQRGATAAAGAGPALSAPKRTCDILQLQINPRAVLLSTLITRF